MYQSGYRPQNLPILPATSANRSHHHAPPLDAVPAGNGKAAMARKKNAHWVHRIRLWLRVGKHSRRSPQSRSRVEKVSLLMLLLAGQALLFPADLLAGGATWSSRSAGISAVESAARSRYSHARSMRSIMAPDRQGHQLRRNLLAARDTEMATALGWAFFDGRHFIGAEEWFGHALKWDPRNAAAAEGLVVAAYRSGDVLKAYRYAVSHADLVPHARGVVGCGLEQRAQTLVAAGRTREANRLLRELGRGTRHTSFARPRFSFGLKGGNSAAPASSSSRSSTVTEGQVKDAIAEGRRLRVQSLARRAGVSREQLAAWTLADLSDKVVAYHRSGDHRSALRMYSRAVRMGEPTFGARKAHALSLYQTGKYRDAAEAFALLAKERNDREVAAGLQNSIKQLEASGGAGTQAGGGAGIGGLMEKCPLVILLKKIGGAGNQ